MSLPRESLWCAHGADLSLVDEAIRPDAECPESILHLDGDPERWDLDAERKRVECARVGDAMERLVGKEHPATVAHFVASSFWFSRSSFVQCAIDDTKRIAGYVGKDQWDYSWYDSIDVHDHALRVVASSSALSAIKREQSSMDRLRRTIAKLGRGHVYRVTPILQAEPPPPPTP